jgi:hypothetical protein
MNSSDVLSGYDRIRGSMSLHRRCKKQEPQNNDSTFRIDIHIWASKKPPEVN